MNLGPRIKMIDRLNQRKRKDRTKLFVFLFVDEKNRKLFQENSEQRA